MNASSIIHEVRNKQNNPVKLIQAVKKHPCIWNSSSPDYRNKLTKHRAWNAIGNETIEGWNESSRTEREVCLRFLVRRWNNIRDYYHKFLKHNARAKVTGINFRRKKYVFADTLKFMKPELQKNINMWLQELQQPAVFKTESLETEDETLETIEGDDGPEFINISCEDQLDCEDSENKKEDGSDSEEVSPGQFSGGVLERVGVTIKNKKKKMSIDVAEDGEAELGSNVDSDAGSSEQDTLRFSKVMKKSTRRAKREDDPDLMFLKSLLPDMKKLADDEKFAFKFAIMQAYMDILRKRI